MTLSEAARDVVQPGHAETVQFLLQDPAWSAYGLGYLESGSGFASSALAATDGDRLQALVLLTQLPRLVHLFARGGAEGVEAILVELVRMDRAPMSGVFSVRSEVTRPLQDRFVVTTSYQMARMRIKRAELRPSRTAAVVRLGPRDLDRVRQIYGMWTDSNQLPAQLERGVYYGIYNGPQLISIAGTHVVAWGARVAAIGNVLTHAAYRNRGLASTTTTAVAEELFERGCEEVVLNVRYGNEPARAAYYRLGFNDYCTFTEGVFHSR